MLNMTYAFGFRTAADVKRRFDANFHKFVNQLTNVRVHNITTKIALCVTLLHLYTSSNNRYMEKSSQFLGQCNFFRK